MMETIITMTVREKMAININFWRSGTRTCQSIRTGIEMTVSFSVSSYAKTESTH